MSAHSTSLLEEEEEGEEGEKKLQLNVQRSLCRVILRVLEKDKTQK